MSSSSSPGLNFPWLSAAAGRGLAEGTAGAEAQTKLPSPEELLDSIKRSGEYAELMSSLHARVERESKEGVSADFLRRLGLELDYALSRMDRDRDEDRNENGWQKDSDQRMRSAEEEEMEVFHSLRRDERIQRLVTWLVDKEIILLEGRISEIIAETYKQQISETQSEKDPEA